MSQNPPTTQSETLAHLTAQMATLMEAVNRLQNASGSALREPHDSPVHPIEQRILDAVATGQAVSLVEIATAGNLQRAGVHYHANRLVSKGRVIKIQANRGKYRCDYVMRRGAVALPGIDP